MICMFYIFDQREFSTLKNFIGRFFCNEVEMLLISIWLVVYMQAFSYQFTLLLQGFLYNEKESIDLFKCLEAQLTAETMLGATVDIAFYNIMVTKRYLD